MSTRKPLTIEDRRRVFGERRCVTCGNAFIPNNYVQRNCTTKCGWAAGGRTHTKRAILSKSGFKDRAMDYGVPLLRAALKAWEIKRGIPPAKFGFGIHFGKTEVGT